jgi:hypothetical protein
MEQAASSHPATIRRPFHDRQAHRLLGIKPALFPVAGSITHEQQTASLLI